MLSGLGKRFCRLFLILTAVLGTWEQAYARSEYEIKAAYLYNFIKFVTWTDTEATASTIDICVYGEDPFKEILHPLKSLTAHGKPINLLYPAKPADAAVCEVLFISREERRQLPTILSQAGQNVLTVSDMKDFASSGGMIGFVTVGNVIRFEINLSSAREAGLDISSKLLELALDVIKK
ncbi:YfiR family protein [Hahella aquimaris]|uniref:YfiR family protein n=1 Tax=Hahella sp. HNIBRBA332 TaxID=3015983 RepID=UPI00273AE9C3|nr:YfiR family protein [Hahella sp. HNIBRBA332]WLQ15597.1 YfiR family protein [Hahella sp. HNIBRBA332]